MESLAALHIALVLCLIHVASSLQAKQNELPDTRVMAGYSADKPVLGNCGRGFDCGYNVSTISKPAVLLDCPIGKKWVSQESLLLRGRNGTSAMYCFVNKAASSYMFNIMSELGMPYLDGERDTGYYTVGELSNGEALSIGGACQIHLEGKECLRIKKELCNAEVSLLIMRNPWDRIASAYVDKVLTKEVFAEVPSFDVFMKTLAGVDPTTVNEHFRPISETCRTEETKQSPKATYNMVLRVEDGDRMREGLHDMFVNKLKFSEDEVVRALNSARHTSAQVQKSLLDPNTGGRLSKDCVDKSIESGLDRTTFYFQQTDPELARKFFQADVDFGSYSFEDVGK